ncbi:DUF2892 domain-containing protein [Emticicia sp. BO119]|uniref:YgaP family membrane protein n=1 Tax=Emticicia sp. BO119 TaxID=2757768 RepID=UPI0015F10BD0|nr:DUF2892 domain-containing protein [Emticicia sp. BO119]MBA4848964.1 DUF2892 domain-containing protein [Emticicia sp. BO119]
MKKNVGFVDSILRSLIAISIGILYLNGIISGTMAIVLITIAVILFLTAFLGFCPLYWAGGISTCSTRRKRLKS